MNESNEYFLKAFTISIGLWFMLAGFARFFIPEKSITNTLLILGIGLCIMLISIKTQFTGKVKA